MRYLSHYDSPLGELLLLSDGKALTGLHFDGPGEMDGALGENHVVERLPIFLETERWLDAFFRGEEPDFTPALSLQGSPFQRRVWDLLLSIPYGSTTTYGELSAVIAAERGIPKMASQAVGGAVGKNPVSIIVPCHRVIGVGGNLVGYGGRLDRKLSLLEMEGLDPRSFVMPSK